MKQINLLPKQSQTQVRFLAFYKLALRLIVLTVGVLVVVGVSATGSWIFTANISSRSDKELRVLQIEESKSDYAKLREDIQGINSILVDTNAIFAKMPKVSNGLKYIIQKLPSGVRLQSVNLEVSKRQLSIVGFSPTREAVLELHKNIVLDKIHFEKVDYPLENLARPKNVPFHFTITLTKDALN